MKNVFQYADLSTHHITQDDQKLLAGGFPLPNPQDSNYIDLKTTPTGFRVIAHEYGWFISVPNLKDHELTADSFRAAVVVSGLSEAFANIIIHAGERGCRWVNFDCDADTEDGMPVFEWE